MSQKSSIYNPLPVDSKSIRILTLFPDEHRTSEIQCELKSAKILDTNGSPTIESPFYALSYTWGEPDFCHTIICNGSEIKITQNLFDALRQLRLKEKSRTLWVDAICINQENTNEKSIQVPLMKNIYQQATAVIIWLGLEDESTIQAIKMIRTASICTLQEPGARTHGQPPAAITYEEFDDKVNTARGFPSIDERDEWQSLARLLGRKWFSRCWIKQESALASQAVVLVGPHLFAWSDLCNATRFFGSKSYGGIHPGFSEVLRNVYDLCRTSRIGRGFKWEPLPLVTLLEWSRNLEATVELDKIYSLLGLAKEGPQITVNYQISIRELYTEVTRLLLQKPSGQFTYPLQVLASVNQYSTKSGQKPKTPTDEPFPSWVVRWRPPKHNDDVRNGEEENKPMQLFAISGMAFSSKFSAGGKEYPGPVIEPSAWDEISLSGFVFTEVSTSVNLYARDPLSRSRLWDFVLDIWSVLQNKDAGYPNGESLDEALAQTLTMSDTIIRMADADAETYHAIDFQHFCVAVYEQTISRMIEEGRTVDVETLNKEWEAEYLRLKSLVGAHTKLPTFGKDVPRTCGGRALFGTTSGHIGVGDATMEQGDLVCVLLGGRTPYILRPVDGGKYRFVGECYLHGIMYGEALEEGLSRKKLFILL
ncbi:HET-domain-containing protein [Acephala macrosclerotiorum]|nr:HET-domain-containing protein [Acephala macrosclerotiorum]